MTLRVRDIPTSYEDAEKLLTKNGSRKISKNGWLIMAPEQIIERCIILKLYHTAIVVYYLGGRLDLACGQYPTRTTQMWINVALGKFSISRGCRGYVDRDIKRGELTFREHTLNSKYYGLGKILPCTI